MADLTDVGHMVGTAERAAADGDFATAGKLLRAIAGIQEAALGPLHPDLANTLNNLAIVAEKTGQISEAETYYRQAVAVASAALPAHDPTVASSRQNLEAFCRERGLRVDLPAVVIPSSEPVAPEPSVLGRHNEDARTPAVSDRPPTVQPWASRPLAMFAVTAGLAFLAALFVMRQRSAREISATVPTASPPASQASGTVSPAPPIPAPAVQTQSPKAVPHASDEVTLVTVQLCRAFSTSGGTWRCEPAGQFPAPGPIVLYTRVRSTRDSTVVHRWYRGDMLRQSVRLRIGANAAEGYRTYSRQTVDAGADWRIEVRNAAGDLLHEQRFTVR